jgi:hypothetical protein
MEDNVTLEIDWQHKGPLDPMPWVMPEYEPQTLNGAPFYRVTGERFEHEEAGAVFFPRYGYAQFEDSYA